MPLAEILQLQYISLAFISSSFRVCLAHPLTFVCFQHVKEFIYLFEGAFERHSDNLNAEKQALESENTRLKLEVQQLKVQQLKQPNQNLQSLGMRTGSENNETMVVSLPSGTISTPSEPVSTQGKSVSGQCGTTNLENHYLRNMTCFQTLH